MSQRLSVRGLIEWHSDRAAIKNAQIGYHPVRMILADQRDAVAESDLLLDEPVSNAADLREHFAEVRRLSAVRPDQPDHAAGGNLQADRVERALAAVAQADVAQPDGRRRCARPDHCGSRTRSSAGQSTVGSRRAYAVPGRPVLTWVMCF